MDAHSSFHLGCHIYIYIIVSWGLYRGLPIFENYHTTPRNFPLAFPSFSANHELV